MSHMNIASTRRQKEQGAITPSLIAAIVFGVLTLGFAGFGFWSYTNYNEQKTDVDGKIALAKAEAKKEQGDSDEAKFAEREKEPRREWVGPDDYGRLTFDYPKTWSAYVAKYPKVSSDAYEVHLNPVSVVNGEPQYALRVVIDSNSYEKTLDTFKEEIKKGDLRSSVTSANGQTGTRLDGNFTKDLRGAAVVYRLRDRTIFIRTDTDTFKPEFENIIKTLKFNT
jgi:hypothetical protein